MSITVFFIALGLAMDAFAVAVSSGCAARTMRTRYALRMALFFGAFQAGMPLIGWLAGLGLRDYIASVDHWVAFALLTAIGAKMIYEARVLKAAENSSPPRPTRDVWPGADELDVLPPTPPQSFYTLLMLSVATSLDALAVGMSLSLLNIGIILPALIIGCVTFALSLAGVYLGKSIGHLFENKLEIVGGLMLILIGLKILLEGLRG
ncbi:MAG: manganese efflux pump MntP family protein [bacterium]|nr:manganese efflux pump MntP family protein [bacterium]